MKKTWVLIYPLSAQRRLWSEWADAQGDLSPRWAHTHFASFVMSWPKTMGKKISRQCHRSAWLFFGRFRSNVVFDQGSYSTKWLLTKCRAPGILDWFKFCSRLGGFCIDAGQNYYIFIYRFDTHTCTEWNIYFRQEWSKLMTLICWYICWNTIYAKPSLLLSRTRSSQEFVTLWHQVYKS